MNKSDRKPTRRISAQTVFLAVVVAGSCAVAGYLLLANRQADGNAQTTVSRFTLDEIPFNGERAYGYLKKLCDIGPRPSGSAGMAIQQKLLAEHFKKLGGLVELQQFRVPHPQHPQKGLTVQMTNIIVHWHPKSKERILLCAHYDTLPFPLEDPDNKRGIFVGANDNASGVAILMELAQEMPNLPANYGIDFVLLDGEEFMFTQRGRYFIGSEYFARDYASGRLPYRYRWGVLLDMVGGKNLQVHQEGNSLLWRDTRPLVESIWSTARGLGVREFIPKKNRDVLDDHVMLHNIGKIPCIDIIDYDYPPWHTQGDTPEQCSPLSLAKVGWVLREWLKTAQ